MSLRRIFENDSFIVVDKPGGWLSTPARFQDRDERPCLGTALQNELGRQIYPVHRLDFEVSGLVIYAKSAEAHRDANRWFEHQQVSKTYRALSEGSDFAHWPAHLPHPSLTPVRGETYEWRCRLLRGKKRAFESPQGKDSRTRATYLGIENDFHCWDLSPLTGRSHQLRYEMSRHGFPILGDRLYGSKVERGRDEIALRAYRLDFSAAPGAAGYGLPSSLFVDVELS